MSIISIFKKKKIVEKEELDIYKLKLENRKERETIMGDVTDPIYQKYLLKAFNMIDETIEKLVGLTQEQKDIEINNLQELYSKNLELFSKELYDNMQVDSSLKNQAELQKIVLLPYIRTYKLTYMCDLYNCYLKDKKYIETSIIKTIN